MKAFRQDNMDHHGIFWPFVPCRSIDFVGNERKKGKREVLHPSFPPEEPAGGEFIFETIQIIADSDFYREFAPCDPKFVS